MIRRRGWLILLRFVLGRLALGVAFQLADMVTLARKEKD